jgi:hypothetical protein
MSKFKSLKQLVKEARDAEAATLSGGSAKDLGAYFKKVTTFLNDTSEKASKLIEEGEEATREPLFGSGSEEERKRVMLYTVEFLKKVRTFLAQSSSQLRKII